MACALSEMVPILLSILGYYCWRW